MVRLIEKIPGPPALPLVGELFVYIKQCKSDKISLLLQGMQ